MSDPDFPMPEARDDFLGAEPMSWLGLEFSGGSHFQHWKLIAPRRHYDETTISDRVC